MEAKAKIDYSYAFYITWCEVNYMQDATMYDSATMFQHWCEEQEEKCDENLYEAYLGDPDILDGTYDEEFKKDMMIFQKNYINAWSIVKGHHIGDLCRDKYNYDPIETIRKEGLI